MLRLSLLFFTSLLFSYNPPYNAKKFHQVLKHSKLQAPTSKFNPLFGTHYGMFKNIAHKYFYLTNQNFLTFYMCGKKNRSELREKDEWKVNTSTPHTLYAVIKLQPLSTQTEFTFLQIHADPKKKIKNNISINKPLLRLTWRKYYRHTQDHLWAIICTYSNNNYSSYIKVDLGKIKKEFQTFKITVQNSILNIFVDNQQKVHLDISYWNQLWNYYKAGVYLQSSGCARAYFKELKF